MSVRIVADTYEWDGKAWSLVVTHTFYGDTEADARAIVAAHKKTDAFFSGCAAGAYGDIRCKTTTRTERVGVGMTTSRKPGTSLWPGIFVGAGVAGVVVWLLLARPRA